MQQLVRVGHVALVGSRGVHAMHQARGGVHPDVRLHSEVPLVALLGLMHLGVAGVVLVLGRGRCRDDGGIHQRALAHEQPALAQVGVDLLEDGLRELVVFQQAAELQQRRGVGHLLPRQVDAHEVAHRLAVVDRIFQAFVAQAVPLLQKVHAQHAWHADRRAAYAPTAGVVRLDTCDQRRPRHHLLHLAQEPLAPRLALLARVFQAGKARLLHASIIPGVFVLRHRA